LGPDDQPEMEEGLISLDGNGGRRKKGEEEERKPRR
jgi:hypothetical protein